jgi:hypothetical protein
MPTIVYYDHFKKFLDETADKLRNMKSDEIEGIYENLVETVLEQESSSEIIEEILAFCSASVLEMIQSGKGSLYKVLKGRDSLKSYSNFHILISSIVSTVVQTPVSDFDEGWIDSLLESVISGLAAIESETISLSGSSLIKLLKWGNVCERLSKRLADHPDFVAILTADMCAMFSRIEEVGSGPFLRMVRFCELLISVSDDEESDLKNKIVETVEREFLRKVYGTTLKTISSKTLPLKWSNELLTFCHRGNELVKPLVGQVFKSSNSTNYFDLIYNSDFIEILANERSRAIPEIVELLFTFEEYEGTTLIISDSYSYSGTLVITDEVYKAVLLNKLESFEMFRIRNFSDFKSITPLAILLFEAHRQILLNWLVYILKLKVKIETKNVELRLHMDISRKLDEYLEF